MAIDRKNIIKQLERATPRGCNWWITVLGGDDQFEQVEYSISKRKFWGFGHITYENETSKRKYREECGVKVVKNKYGDAVLHIGRPFGGAVPAEPRFYPSYLCKAIPMGISHPKFLEDAPEDLFKGIVRDLDEILERCRNSEPTKIIRNKHIKLYEINEKIP